MFAVAIAAPTPLAAAAIRQSAWWSVLPRSANACRQVPARWPSATPSGARRSPRNSRCAIDSSPGRKPRQISSTEMTHTHGSTSKRRKPATRAAAGRPRSASIRTVESSSSRAMVSRCAGYHRVAAVEPTLRGRYPNHGRCRGAAPGRLQCRPSASRPQDRAGSFRRLGRFDGGHRHAGRVRQSAHLAKLYVFSWA